MERVKEESSYILESSRKVGVLVYVGMIAEPWGRRSSFPSVSHTDSQCI